MLQLHRYLTRIGQCLLEFEQRLIDNLITTQNKRMMLASQLLDVSEAQIFELAWRAYNRGETAANVAQEAYRQYLRTDQCPPWLDLYLDHFFEEFERRHMRA